MNLNPTPDCSDNPSPAEPTTRAQRYALLVGIFVCLFLALMRISGLVQDREGQAQTARESIAASWAPAQQVLGPILVVPGDRTREVVETTGQRRTVVEPVEFRILPEAFRADAQLDYEERKLGIFPTPIFTATISLEADFKLGQVAESLPRFSGVTWKPEKAWLEIEVSDSRAVLSSEPLLWNDEPLTMVAGKTVAKGGSPILRVDGAQLASGGRLAGVLRLATTDSFRLIPVGENSVIRLRSTWSDPSFVGGRLPNQRHVSADGFNATWETGAWARGVPSFWHTVGYGTAPDRADFEKSALGAVLRRSVDVYRLSQRATQYGFLFLLVGLGALAAVDLRLGERLPLASYICAGGALVLFFLTLLAAAEHLPFGLAYTLASVIEVGVLGWYLQRLNLGGRIVVSLLSAIGLAHGYLYFVLRLEDHALLAGTVVFWALLISLMVFFHKRPEPSPVG